jgi:hypothetical protein
MDKVTQQNAANAEECASASEELSSQAESMNEIVNELVALVGGAAARNNGKGRNVEHHANIKVDNEAAKRTHELTAKTKNHSLSKTDHAFHQIAGGSKTSRAKATAAAEKAIPLDNDKSNFSEFNS